MKYEFVGSCPGLPAWFVDWVADDAEPDEIEFDEVEELLEGNESFEAYMEYRLEDPKGPKLHPGEDWSIRFLKGQTPRGLPYVVIQDSGIENVYVAGDFDIDAEEAYAREHGLGFHFQHEPKCSTKKLKARLLR
jgi:hypothetical protein